MAKEEGFKDLKRIQKLVPKGDVLSERYSSESTEATEWFVVRKIDNTYQMYHVENDKAVKLGRATKAPIDLEKYVSWCKTE